VEEINKFSSNLKALRKTKGISQCELAQQLMICQNTVSNWEHGISEPNIEHIKSLATILNVTTIVGDWTVKSLKS
jgi:putative transcriptional regulator